MVTLFGAEKQVVLECKICDFKCCKKSNYKKHLSTLKHAANAKGSTGDIKNAAFDCDKCSKNYSSRNGLWKHKKTCNIEEDEDVDIGVDEDVDIGEDVDAGEETITIGNTILDSSSSEIRVLTSLIAQIVKSNTELQHQNSELQKQVIDVCRINNSQIMINNNSNNKTFNLQIFLNEQCKDAMNMSEFVESFDLQLSDLESVGDLGYVDGITKIFVDKLNSMDVHKRPIHCSDAKREILYIKDEDKWEREKPNNPKLRKAIKNVSFKNMKLANLWSETHPESRSSESRLNDVYMKIVLESTGGSGDILESQAKIIKRIAKEIVIEKKHM
jgi:hypothetical protein